jgi:hypothetical protein
MSSAAASKQVTIRMPKESLANWLAALRSGEYDQCAGRLKSEGRYCCLGVLQEVVSGRIVAAEDEEVPADSWLAEHRVDFRTDLGISSPYPYLPSLQLAATEANDTGKTFAEIADAIEACAEAL